MLVLTRKIGEQVIIADGIRVQVIAVHGNRVRLGFMAPADIVIQREELCFEVPVEQHREESTPLAAR